MAKSAYLLWLSLFSSWRDKVFHLIGVVLCWLSYHNTTSLPVNLTSFPLLLKHIVERSVDVHLLSEHLQRQEYLCSVCCPCAPGKLRSVDHTCWSIYGLQEIGWVSCAPENGSADSCDWGAPNEAECLCKLGDVAHQHNYIYSSWRPCLKIG